MVAGETGFDLAQQEKQHTIDELARWVKQQLPASEAAVEAWQPLGGDAGFRNYFRLGEQSGLMAVWSPPKTEKNREFVAIAGYLRLQGIHTPDIRAYDPVRGFMVVEDLGEQLLLDLLTDKTVENYYQQALDVLVRLQRCPPENTIFKAYDRQELLRELNLFTEWFVPKLLGHSLDEAEEKLLAHTFDLLCDSALEQTQVIVHRDFHSRNLVYCEHSPLGVIDFQDAVQGPVTYDLVSLLRDCYIQWPAEQVEHWAQDYRARAVDAGILSAVDDETFIRWFDWMGLQRHIKVLGIFARLYLRDGKAGYLQDLPLVIHYTRSVASKYPQLKAFTDWFDQRLMPRIYQQDWMSQGD
ncbi:aminoglycoside phosphotransferase family protein [Teredinibacter haidensis]|uniref:aminoglycoside phosphotransferase family protein n=1 Tax=Teredinibacter haidensis TaxID=2731755 RepID=UPI000A7ECECB|nr:phosphotransferase [Teredinibacter haidensis]